MPNNVFLVGYGMSVAKLTQTADHSGCCSSIYGLKYSLLDLYVMP
jgi:hypothetical protein